ncbi:MAG: hypothetical protein WAV00_08450 [Nocardioides sp.]
MAVFGMVTNRIWAIPAVIAVGADLATALIAAFVGLEGWPVGLVLSGLAIVLAAVAGPRRTKPVTS